ncbi:immunoglobulin superfamily member 5 isoform B [Alligator mississippiensis]|nr:immunoglobulin superfamily member 5 isoform B [Alligator mississippiensis]
MHMARKTAGQHASSLQGQALTAHVLVVPLMLLACQLQKEKGLGSVQLRAKSLQKFILVSFTLFVSLTGLGFCYTIVRGPANATVLAGSEARFNCTVSQDWKIIIWLSNGKLVLTVVNPTGPVITDNRFTSQNYTAGNEFTSELIIHVVRQSDSGKIECGSQGGSENGYAFLTVQVNGSLFIKDSNLTVKVNKTIEIFCEALGWAPAPNITWKINNSFVDKSMYITEHGQESNGLHNTTSILTLTPLTNETLTCLADIRALSKPQNATVTLILVESPLENTGDGTSTWIIIVAVVVSVVGFLLLIIIIVIIVYCCHRQKKKESTYQKEMRKVSAKKKDDGSLETRRRNGSENNGYIPEESWHPEQMPKVASLPPMASNFYGPEDLEVSSTSQISTQVPRQSSLLSRRSPLLYRNSIPLVQHFNHHRQQPKNQFLKSNQFRVSHPKPKFCTQITIFDLTAGSTQKSKTFKLRRQQLPPPRQEETNARGELCGKKANTLVFTLGARRIAGSKSGGQQHFQSKCWIWIGQRCTAPSTSGPREGQSREEPCNAKRWNPDLEFLGEIALQVFQILEISLQPPSVFSTGGSRGEGGVQTVIYYSDARNMVCTLVHSIELGYVHKWKQCIHCCLHVKFHFFHNLVS